MNNTIDNKGVMCSVPKKHKVYRPSRSILRGIPPEIENNIQLIKAMEILPRNYNFEIPKTIWRIKKANAKKVTLQCPEGLVSFVSEIANIIEDFTDAETVIMGDVTYGACCIDDETSKRVGADFMIHYGHSCLIPIDQTESIPCLYVFVDIQFDALYLLEKIKCVFSTAVPLALVSIIQFVASLQIISSELKQIGYTVVIPQSKPLSPGEILGCTSAPVPKGYTIICLGDGRFHLESIMISNPDVETYLYNPYSKVMSREYYDQPMMKEIRRNEILKASKAEIWGIINGTLGRQGSPKVLETIQMQLEKAGKTYFVTSASEIFPKNLDTYSNIEAWVQIACPRLSFDWGASFKVPLLNPYEASVALKGVIWDDSTYPMDYYAYDSAGPWTPNHKLQHKFVKKNKCNSDNCCVNKE